jgi:hypothetical protein
LVTQNANQYGKNFFLGEKFFSRREEEKFFFDPLAGFFMEYRLRGCYQYDSKYFFGTPSSAQSDCKKSYLISMNIR